MKVTESKLNGVLIVEPTIYSDNRGTFFECYSKRKYLEQGVKEEFVQDNHSISEKGTLRGLHYQVSGGQAKLVRVTRGRVFDVVVDIRKESPTFGQWVGIELSGENFKQVYIPIGFAHGFCVLSDSAEFLYKCSNYYSPEDERGIIWNDPDIAIDWPIKNPILSEKDQALPAFRDI